MNLNEKLEKIKSWLGTGSLNIFGLPMSGKDTVGMRLAEDLQAKFLSSSPDQRPTLDKTRESLRSSSREK